jgi:hypothetical protein
MSFNEMDGNRDHHAEEDRQILPIFAHIWNLGLTVIIII